jgi:purine-binding chemotaxis protein CheW
MIPLPNAPQLVAGLLNVAGQFIPVIDLGKRFGLRDKQVELEDYFVICRLRDRDVALWVDRIGSIINLKDNPVQNAHRGIQDLPHIQGVIEVEDQVLFIYDLEALLTVEEERQLNAALENAKLIDGERD